MTQATELAVAATVVSGALVALQQRINGSLAVSLHDAILAAVVSFGTGLVAVLVAVSVRRSARASLAGLRSLPWWWRLGGLGGASLVAVGAAAAPRMGVAMLTIGLVAGSTIGALVVDELGLGPSGRHAPTPPRIVGAGLCLVAILVAASGGVRGASPWLFAVVVGAGGCVSFQQAVNGRVRSRTDATAATLQNFVVGFTALVLGFLVHRAVAGASVGMWPSVDRWWLYLGGPIGATFVAVAAVVVRVLGVLRLGLGVTAGQLLGGVLLDLHRGIGATTVVGAFLAMAAVALSGGPVRRRVAAT